MSKTTILKGLSHRSACLHAGGLGLPQWPGGGEVSL